MYDGEVEGLKYKILGYHVIFYGLNCKFHVDLEYFKLFGLLN